MGDRAFFFAHDGTHGQELWVSNGTPLGTVLVTDLAAGDLLLSSQAQLPSPFYRGPDAAALNDLFLFIAEASTGMRLWSSDGTALGTADLATTDWGFNTGIGILGGQAYFVGNSPDSGLWRSDGTPGGTGIAVPDSATLNFGGEGPLVSAGQRLFFDGGYDPGAGTINYTLLTTDGTVAGSSGLLPQADTEYRTALGNRLVFTHRDATHGYEPWITDGTVAGTALLTDVLPGLASSAPQTYTELGDALFFAADDGTHGVELWRTDGTSLGTQLFLDIAPGLVGSYPRCLTELGGLLYFAAYRAGEGSELWRSDGTLLGTELVADLAAGEGSSSPCGFARVGNKVVFTAWDETFGRELRVIDDLGQVLLPSAFEDGTFGDWSHFVN